jgi:hypothetical protein
MQLGLVKKGVVRAVRYYRSTEVIKDKNDEIYIRHRVKGGITFLFQIDYNDNTLAFSAAITKENEIFDRIEGKKVCEIKASQTFTDRNGTYPNDEYLTFKIPYQAGTSLIDQVFFALQDLSNRNELKLYPFFQTLYKRMKKYDQENSFSEKFFQDMYEQMSTKANIEKSIDMTEF